MSGPAPPAGRLRRRIVPVSDLDSEARASLWGLFSRYYAGTDRSRFDRDLAGKDHVILLHDRAGSLRGFSTLARYRRSVQGRAFIAVFSGDTIVDEACWGDRALQNAFGSYVTGTLLRHPRTTVYWFLISKGYKTYLLLTRNFRDHWPRRDRPTPPFEKGVIDALARERFGGSWDPVAGLVRAEAGSGRLRGEVAPIDAGLLADKDIRFFVERNPGHARGDELGCLGRVDGMLWLRYVVKRARRTTARTVERLRWAVP